MAGHKVKKPTMQQEIYDSGLDADDEADEIQRFSPLILNKKSSCLSKRQFLENIHNNNRPLTPEIKSKSRSVSNSLDRELVPVCVPVHVNPVNPVEKLKDPFKEKHNDDDSISSVKSRLLSLIQDLVIHEEEKSDQKYLSSGPVPAIDILEEKTLNLPEVEVDDPQSKLLEFQNDQSIQPVQVQPIEPKELPFSRSPIHASNIRTNMSLTQFPHSWGQLKLIQTHLPPWKQVDPYLKQDEEEEEYTPKRKKTPTGMDRSLLKHTSHKRFFVPLPPYPIEYSNMCGSTSSKKKFQNIKREYPRPWALPVLEGTINTPSNRSRKEYEVDNDRARRILQTLWQKEEEEKREAQLPPEKKSDNPSEALKKITSEMTMIDRLLKEISGVSGDKNTKTTLQRKNVFHNYINERQELEKARSMSRQIVPTKSRRPSNIPNAPRSCNKISNQENFNERLIVNNDQGDEMSSFRVAKTQHPSIPVFNSEFDLPYILKPNFEYLYQADVKKFQEKNSKLDFISNEETINGDGECEVPLNNQGQIRESSLPPPPFRSRIPRPLQLESVVDDMNSEPLKPYRVQEFVSKSAKINDILSHIKDLRKFQEQNSKLEFISQGETINVDGLCEVPMNNQGQIREPSPPPLPLLQYRIPRSLQLESVIETYSETQKPYRIQKFLSKSAKIKTLSHILRGRIVSAPPDLHLDCSSSLIDIRVPSAKNFHQALRGSKSFFF